MRVSAGGSSPVRGAVLGDFPKLADSAPVLVSDAVLFKWARISTIARLLPVMSDVRVLERVEAAHSCRSCQKKPVIDRSALSAARAALAECSDETALLVKQAAGVVKYKVSYRRLQEPVKEVIR